MPKGKSSRLSTRETYKSYEATAHESSHRPRCEFSQCLGTVKGSVKDDLNKLKPSRSEDSHSCSPVPQNDDHYERVSSTTNIEADTQSALRGAQEAAKHLGLSPLDFPALSVIPQWLTGHSEFKDISSTAMDVQRVIQVFDAIISYSAPHLYVSALPFSPVNSPLSRKLSARFPNVLRAVSGRDMNWPAVQAMLKGHTDSVQSVSFSPDGTRIVTGSVDTTVRLWDAAMGQPVGEPLRGHTHWVQSVVESMRRISQTVDACQRA